MTPESLRIVFDAEGLVAVDKPPGIPSTGKTLDDPNCVQHLLSRRIRRKVWAVHQLDADTSGLLLFVRRKRLVADWQQRLAPPTGEKTYLALCHGVPSWSTQEIREPIGYDPQARRPAVMRSGKPAQSVARVLTTGSDHAWLAVTIATGRTHQVRVHLAHAGHALVGEQRHRDPACALHPRHALHAARLRFRDATPHALDAPLPADLLALSARLVVPIPALD